MKLIDVYSKATLEDFLTLKETELVQFLQKYNEKISDNKNELALRAFMQIKRSMVLILPSMTM